MFIYLLNATFRFSRVYFLFYFSPFDWSHICLLSISFVANLFILCNEHGSIIPASCANEQTYCNHKLASSIQTMQYYIRWAPTDKIVDGSHFPLLHGVCMHWPSCVFCTWKCLQRIITIFRFYRESAREREIRILLHFDVDAIELHSPNGRKINQDDDDFMTR